MAITYLGYWANGYWSYQYWDNGYWPTGETKILASSSVITVWDTEKVEFTGADGEWASVIVNGVVYRVENDDGDFIWDSLGRSTERAVFEQGVHEGVTTEYQGEWQPFNVTWDGYINNSHFFTVEIVVEEECDRTRRMSAALAEVLANKVTEHNINPSHDWSDFNPVHKRWNFVRKLGVRGKETIICQEDIPDEPKIEEYTDNDA